MCYCFPLFKNSLIYGPIYSHQMSVCCWKFWGSAFHFHLFFPEISTSSNIILEWWIKIQANMIYTFGIFSGAFPTVYCMNGARNITYQTLELRAILQYHFIHFSEYSYVDSWYIPDYSNCLIHRYSIIIYFIIHPHSNLVIILSMTKKGEVWYYVSISSYVGYQHLSDIHSVFFHIYGTCFIKFNANGIWDLNRSSMITCEKIWQ